MYYVFLTEEGQHTEEEAFEEEGDMLAFIARRTGECWPAKVYFRVIEGLELAIEPTEMAVAFKVKVKR